MREAQTGWSGLDEISAGLTTPALRATPPQLRREHPLVCFTRILQQPGVNKICLPCVT